ncbi:MAG: hypothetical protein CMD97_00055 [Gammaproteobacteria bacterium]|nr:hypothetical protein [Gammaproteobacteria bacterium]
MFVLQIVVIFLYFKESGICIVLFKFYCYIYIVLNLTLMGKRVSFCFPSLYVFIPPSNTGRAVIRPPRLIRRVTNFPSASSGQSAWLAHQRGLNLMVANQQFENGNLKGGIEKYNYSRIFPPTEEEILEIIAEHNHGKKQSTSLCSPN